jgi:hypothetical protein
MTLSDLITIEFGMLSMEGELCQQEEDIFADQWPIAWKASALHNEPLLSSNPMQTHPADPLR